MLFDAVASILTEEQAKALSAQGASYTFLKGARVVAVAAGGVGQPAQRKDALRALASAVAKKL